MSSAMKPLILGLLLITISVVDQLADAADHTPVGFHNYTHTDGSVPDDTYRIAAMMPLGAWGCDEVKRGTTPATCKTTQTAVWVLHCPLDHVSRISEQLTLFHSYLDCGGYGRFTMIPGNGHISRPPNDDEFFSMRMGWMLAQTYGTPFNYVVKVNDGTIVDVASGERPSEIVVLFAQQREVQPRR